MSKETHMYHDARVFKVIFGERLNWINKNECSTCTWWAFLSNLRQQGSICGFSRRAQLISNKMVTYSRLVKYISYHLYKHVGRWFMKVKRNVCLPFFGPKSFGAKEHGVYLLVVHKNGPHPIPVYPMKNGWISPPQNFFRGFTLLGVGNDDGTWLDRLKMLGSVAATRIWEFHPKDTGHVGSRGEEGFWEGIRCGCPSYCGVFWFYLFFGWG